MGEYYLYVAMIIAKEMQNKLMSTTSHDTVILPGFNSRSYDELNVEEQEELLCFARATITGIQIYGPSAHSASFVHNAHNLRNNVENPTEYVDLDDTIKVQYQTWVELGNKILDHES